MRAANTTTLTGAQLLSDVLDVITDGLPRLAPDDPARPPLSRLAPLLARELGRPAGRLVTQEADHAS